MEAEYMAVFDAIQELSWIKGVLGEIRIHLVDSINLYMDSKSAMRLIKNLTNNKHRQKFIQCLLGA